MRTQENTRVIWKHPLGRFELRETEHYSLFEHRTYVTRECVFTPEVDARGLASDVCVPYQPPEDKPRRVFRQVTPEEEEQFADLYRDGMLVREIARKFGRSDTTIAAALRRQGCRLQPRVYWTDSEVRKAVKMRKAGAMYKEIGAALGKSEGAVQDKFIRMGLELIV